MDELISKRMAIDTFKDCAENGVGIDGIVDALESLPLAKPQRIKGRWIYSSYDDEYGFDESWTCDKCGYSTNIEETNFCPKCGTDMRGEDNETN